MPRWIPTQKQIRTPSCSKSAIWNGAEEQCQKPTPKINYCFGWTKMTSARNSRVSFVRNAGIIGHSTHAPKTVKYFVYVNIFAKYNQYFLLFEKLKPFIRTINVSQLTQWLLFTDNWFYVDFLCPTKWFAQSRTTPLWISSNLTPKTKRISYCATSREQNGAVRQDPAMNTPATMYFG